MGKLKPGAEYVYTRRDNTVYQRERGTYTEEIIGWDYDPRTEDGRPLCDHIMDAKLWGNIKKAAKTNPLLKEALERAIMIYHLSEKNGKE